MFVNFRLLLTLADKENDNRESMQKKKQLVVSSWDSCQNHLRIALKNSLIKAESLFLGIPNPNTELVDDALYLSITSDAKFRSRCTTLEQENFLKKRIGTTNPISTIAHVKFSAEWSF